MCDDVPCPPLIPVDDSAILDCQFSDFYHTAPQGFEKILFEQQIFWTSASASMFTAEFPCDLCDTKVTFSQSCVTIVHFFISVSFCPPLCLLLNAALAKLWRCVLIEFCKTMALCQGEPSCSRNNCQLLLSSISMWMPNNDDTCSQSKAVFF